MKKLAKAILEVMVIEYGTTKVLERLSNPLWFQAFNNAIGMDWDSSGSTTVTTAIIKEVLRNSDLGIVVAGGKGKVSLRTPEEVATYGEKLGLSATKISELTNISRLTAKIDTVLLQDGFALYHHALVFSDKGEWVVIQQGMNTESRIARRYHIAWFKITPNDLSEEPHTGVASDTVVKPLNLTDKVSRECKKVIIDLLNEPPKKIYGLLHEVNRLIKGVRTLVGTELVRPIDRSIPYYRPVRLTHTLLTKLMRAYELKPKDIKEALLVRNLGPEVFRALSLVSELIYREPPSLRDPTTEPYDPFKYAFTVGGKDGIPFPVKRELMIKVISELRDVIESAKLGKREKLLALKSLSKYAPKDLGVH